LGNGEWGKEGKWRSGENGDYGERWKLKDGERNREIRGQYM
jgi:hypothetical protein